MDRYHHGDLKEALIAIGFQRLDQGRDVEASLRGLARDAGVSHAAPYRHFADREAFIRELVRRTLLEAQHYMQNMRLRHDLPSQIKLEHVLNYWRELVISKPQRARLIASHPLPDTTLFLDEFTRFFATLNYSADWAQVSWFAIVGACAHLNPVAIENLRLALRRV